MRVVDNPPEGMPLREAVLLWGEILDLGGPMNAGGLIPGAVGPTGVAVMPATTRDTIGRAMRRMNPAGMARMALAVQAYLSVLGMAMVTAVDEEIQPAQREGTSGLLTVGFSTWFGTLDFWITWGWSWAVQARGPHSGHPSSLNPGKPTWRKQPKFSGFLLGL